MQTALATVPNPVATRKPFASHLRGVTTYKEPKEATVKVERSQSDVIGRMYDRRQIGEELFKAARLFQKTHEAADAPLRSSGDIREYVDGGMGPQIPITDNRQRAAKLLGEWRNLLGEVGFGFVEAVVIGLPGRDPMTIREYADLSRTMMPGPRSTVFHGHLFRCHLVRLAKAMGYA